MMGPRAGYYNGPPGLHGYEEHTNTQRSCQKGNPYTVSEFVQFFVSLLLMKVKQ